MIFIDILAFSTGARSRRLSAMAAVAFAVAGVCSPADATVVEYTSAAAFSAATTGDTIYNFSGAAPGAGFTAYANGLTVGPATINATGQGGSLYVGASGASGSTYGVPFLTAQYGEPNAFTLNAPAETAIGIYFGSYSNTNSPLTIRLSTGDVFNVNLPPVTNTIDFIGFTSLTPITSLTLSAPGGALDSTGFTIGSAVSPVPLPSALPLFASAIAGIAGFGTRKVRPNATV